ncbi:MAG: PQQ-binding-like beta-propeller repeat protein [Candidatus Binataceae bacterium]|nr:PQQ-binding-like beta-propeller repeat protein [Candidatus Binataceae bacterium]
MKAHLWANFAPTLENSVSTNEQPDRSVHQYKPVHKPFHQPIRAFLIVVASLVFLQSLILTLARAEPPVPVAAGGPYDRVYNPANIPNGSDAAAGPNRWWQAYGGPTHNASYPAARNAPLWLVKGVTWGFSEARAWPLTQTHPFNTATLGERSAQPIQTQSIGNALGVSMADGVVYAESDDMFVYAINAKTGNLIWRTSPIANNLMGNPLIVGDKVFVSAGSVAFNFANVENFARNPDSAIRGDAINYNGVFALDRLTGSLLWYFPTRGETMTTPAYDAGLLFVATGAGNVHALRSENGSKVWTAHLGGIANMASPAAADGVLYVAMSVKPYLYALDEKTGKVLWCGEIPGAVNTGMGDVAPAVDDDVVAMDAVSDPRVEHGIKTVDTTIRGFDAKSGAVLWTAQMGRGLLPPAFKGGMPMIHDGVLYLGSPVNSIYQARSLHTGKLLWQWKAPDADPAGAGRSPGSYYDGTLYIATGPDVYAIDPKSGKMTGRKHVGGRFGLINPVIVGGTVYLANSWDRINALPLSEITPVH